MSRAWIASLQTHASPRPSKKGAAVLYTLLQYPLGLRPLSSQLSRPLTKEESLLTSIFIRSYVIFSTQRAGGYTPSQHIPYHNVTLPSRYTITSRTNTDRVRALK